MDGVGPVGWVHFRVPWRLERASEVPCSELRSSYAATVRYNGRTLCTVGRRPYAQYRLQSIHDSTKYSMNSMIELPTSHLRVACATLAMLADAHRGLAPHDHAWEPWESITRYYYTCTLYGSTAYSAHGL